MKAATARGSLANRLMVRNILDAAARERGGSVSKQRARALEDHPDFPAPVDVLEDGQGREIPIFRRAEVEQYAANRSTTAGRPRVAAVAD